ncbi:MAG: hypothetical protein ABI885_18190 [Gammaproteobacteria bacterium]
MDYDFTDKVHLKVVASDGNYGGVYTQNPDVSPLGLGHAYGTFDVHQKTGEFLLPRVSTWFRFGASSEILRGLS